MRHFNAEAAPRNDRHGFTLVELLVVIGVIIVLISILLPALTRVQEAAVRTKCASNLKQIHAGILQYAINNMHWYPPYSNQGGDGDGWFNNAAGGDSWGKPNPTVPNGFIKDGTFKTGFGYLIERATSSPRYIGNWRVFYCPNIQKSAFEDGNAKWWNDQSGASLVDSNYMSWNSQHTTINKYVARKSTESPALTILGDRCAWNNSGWAIDNRSRSGVRATNHRDGGNFLFNDGHVEFQRFGGPRKKAGFYPIGQLNANTPYQFATIDIYNR